MSDKLINIFCGLMLLGQAILVVKYFIKQEWVFCSISLVFVLVLLCLLYFSIKRNKKLRAKEVMDKLMGRY
jgi:thiol:disulfide interchange protein